MAHSMPSKLSITFVNHLIVVNTTLAEMLSCIISVVHFYVHYLYVSFFMYIRTLDISYMYMVLLFHFMAFCIVGMICEKNWHDVCV